MKEHFVEVNDMVRREEDIFRPGPGGRRISCPQSNAGRLRFQRAENSTTREKRAPSCGDVEDLPF